MARKIVQIAMCGHKENAFTQCEWTAIALANDGTVWTMNNRTHRLPSPWELIAMIPQVVVPGEDGKDADRG